jgi:hypothetical protein
MNLWAGMVKYTDPSEFFPMGRKTQNFIHIPQSAIGPLPNCNPQRSSFSLLSAHILSLEHLVLWQRQKSLCLWSLLRSSYGASVGSREVFSFRDYPVFFSCLTENDTIYKFLHPYKKVMRIYFRSASGTFNITDQILVIKTNHKKFQRNIFKKYISLTQR